MTGATTAMPLTEYSSFPTRKKCRRSPGMHKGSFSDQWRQVLSHKEFGTLNVLLFVLIAFREVRANSSLRYSSFAEWRRAAKLKYFWGSPGDVHKNKQTNKWMRYSSLWAQDFIELTVSYLLKCKETAIYPCKRRQVVMNLTLFIR